jgi:hypothetical protein
VLGVRQADGVGEVVPNIEGHPDVGFHIKTLKALPVGRRENSQRMLLKTHRSGSASKVSIFIFSVAFPGHALKIAYRQILSSPFSNYFFPPPGLDFSLAGMLPNEADAFARHEQFACDLDI